MFCRCSVQDITSTDGNLWRKGALNHFALPAVVCSGVGERDTKLERSTFLKGHFRDGAHNTGLSVQARQRCSLRLGAPDNRLRAHLRDSEVEILGLALQSARQHRYRVYRRPLARKERRKITVEGAGIDFDHEAALAELIEQILALHSMKCRR